MSRNPPRPDQPGFSRDRDLEKARGTKRPAQSDMDADERAADRKPDDWIHYAPDPDDDRDDQA